MPDKDESTRVLPGGTTPTPAPGRPAEPETRVPEGSPPARAADAETKMFGDIDTAGAEPARERAFVEYPVAPGTTLIGGWIGPYRIVSELGAGGMGSVYLAEQTEPFKRRVALKVIRSGMDSDEVLARFRSERELLARMTHPNIASVLDVGATPEGRLYFAMEYVPGIPLEDLCDRRNFDLKHRLELFLQACEGVQHAHQKGVIHRDLKPSNLMVADFEGHLLVKVIDFGIAKSMDSFGNAEPGTTTMGTPIGTPSYMSPEQASGDLGAVDTRTDVYSLGVVLYKLITRELPIPSDVIARAINVNLHTVLAEAVVRAPSRRVAELSRSEAAAWKKTMGADAATHARRIRGDLDWVTLKALERDRERRYASVSELAADVQRFLAGQPVLAGAPSRAYRLKKFILRNRVAVGAGVAVFLALIVGVIGTTWMAVEAREQRAAADAARLEAERQRDRALATRGFLEEMIAAPDPWKLDAGHGARDVRVVDAVGDAAKKLDPTLVQDAGLRGEIGTLLGRTFRRLGRLDAAREQLERAVAALASVYAETAPERIEAELELAFVLSELGEHAEADRRLVALLPRVDARGVRAEYRDEARRVHADVRNQLGDVDGAVAAARATLADAMARHGADSTASSGARAALADLLANRGDWAEADALMTAAYDTERQRLGPAHPIVLELLSKAANLAVHKGDYATAEQRYREAAVAAEQVLGPEHPDTLRYYAHVAMALDNAGERDKAIALFERVLPQRTRVLGEDHADVLTMRSNYAVALRALGRFEDATAQMEDVLQRRRRVLGETHPDTLRTLAFLATLAKDRNDLERGEALLAQASALCAQINGPDHPDTLLMENNYFAILRDRGKLDQALAGYAGLVARATRVLPPAHWHLASIRVNYGRTLYLAKRYAEAEPLLVESYATIRAQFAADDARVAAVRARIEELYRLWGRPDRAAEVIRAAETKR